MQNGDKLTPSYSCIAIAVSPAGVYPIIPMLTDSNGRLGNYTVALNNGILTVQKATASVALSNLTQIYDGTPKAATATTTPVGLTVAIAYDGNTNAPVAAGGLRSNSRSERHKLPSHSSRRLGDPKSDAVGLMG